MLVSVVIPCYKSSETIRKVVEETMAQFEQMKRGEVEFVLVDDCSPDDGATVRALRTIVKDYPNVKAVELAKNSGQHNAQMAALNYAKGDFIISMDDDGQTSPTQLPKLLDEMDKPPVSRVIYPVPGPNGKGVLVVPTVHGNTLLGPNSEPIEDKEANNTTADALSYVKKNVCKTVDNIPFDKIIRTFAGLRPSGDTGDFVIEESKVEGFINVACIESPGLASAPAIAEYVLTELMKGRWTFPAKAEYKHRKPVKVLAEMSDEDKNSLVKENPAYGEIVCRCRRVSKGEVLDVIRRPVGATTVKGVKKRIGPGMGRCQGGFCEPLIVEILASELGIAMEDVRYGSKDSYILMDRMGADASHGKEQP